MSQRSAPELLRLGRKHRDQGNAEAAVRALMRAVELEPRSVPALLELGGLLDEQGDVDAAILCSGAVDAWKSRSRTIDALPC